MRMLTDSSSCPPTPADRLARRHRLARLGLAWLANMQVMMFAFPGYFLRAPMGADNRILLEHAVVAMNWISLALTLPVMLYCAWPVWNGAWRRAQGGGISMDVPVALGMVAAFVPSAWATWTGQGEVYFESVTMFVAFLLTARYLAPSPPTPDPASRTAAGAQPGREAVPRERPSFAPSAGEGSVAHPVFDRMVGTVSALAQRLAFWFVLVQLTLALAVGAAWLAWMPQHAVPVTVALLVMSCPCAMALAVPTALAAAHAALRRAPLASEAAVRALAARTQRVTQQNLYGAIAWHLLMTPLAAVGLVQPWLAAIAMLVSSLAVAANAWRLARRARAPHLSAARRAGALA